MQGRTHMLGGAVAVAATILVTDMPLSPGLAITAMGVGAIGATIPDIDHPNSKISHKLKPVSAIVTLMFSHRGIFHSPILYVLLNGLWAAFYGNQSGFMWGQFLFIGIFSHLLLDALNPTGVPLLFPFEKKRRHFAKIKTGSKTESVVRWTLTAAELMCIAAICLPVKDLF